MDTTRRAAGLGLLTYAIATFGAFVALGSPGGAYSEGVVSRYIGSGHWVAAWALCYVGALGALGLLAFGARMRSILADTGSGDLLWGLSIAAATTSVIGWFVDGGLVVAMAEGGGTVQSGVPHPVVYTLTETGNLLAVCAPALFLGVAAIVMAKRLPQPTWLRAFCVVAGVCGILAPVYFTYFVYVLWTLTFSGWMLLTARRTAPATRTQASLV